MYFFDLFYSSFCDLCFLRFPAFSEEGSYRPTFMFSIAGRLKVSLSLINGVNDYREMEDFITMRTRAMRNENKIGE